MGLSQKILSPALRFSAAVALVAFLAAQTLCFIHCNFGSQGDSGPLSCHGAVPAKVCHKESDPSSPVPPRTTTCFTLQNLVTSGDAPTLVVPEFSVLYQATPLALALDATATEPDASFSRRVNHRDWVFTPEVSLGPAFRSLAPPFIV